MNMNMRTLQHDVELDNAVYFGSYVLVLTDGEVTGGGRVNAYDDNEVWWAAGSMRGEFQRLFIRHLRIFKLTLYNHFVTT